MKGIPEATAIILTTAERTESYTSVKQLRQHIDAFIDAYNADAQPFVWTKSEAH
jgi:glutamyl-tRNA reductase